jgi:hypothetical protein
MFEKRFVIVSMVSSFPAYLKLGKAPLFDNFQITGVDFHFSTTVTFAVRCESEAAAEVYIGGLLYVHPRFAPLTVIAVYDPVVMVPPADRV